MVVYYTTIIHNDLMESMVYGIQLDISLPNIDGNKNLENLIPKICILIGCINTYSIFMGTTNFHPRRIFWEWHNIHQPPTPQHQHCFHLVRWMSALIENDQAATAYIKYVITWTLKARIGSRQLKTVYISLISTELITSCSKALGSCSFSIYPFCLSSSSITLSSRSTYFQEVPNPWIKMEANASTFYLY